MWRYKLRTFLGRFVILACCNALDALILFQGIGLRIQIGLVVFYRWTLYTPKAGDLISYIIFGFFWDAIYQIPLGFHSFLIILVFMILSTQKRYLQVSQQYMRWIIFLGVLILINQIEYSLRLMLGQQIVISYQSVLSILLTFSLYPLIFRTLQRYDR
jgi:rod shape-determining protein MreD